MNVIFGSGVVGLLAKLFLPDWKVIPFARSRFFTWNPALDDNFIIQDDELDHFIKDITQIIGKPQKHLYSRKWSISGELYGEYNNDLCNGWLNKLFDGKIPSQVPLYMKDRLNLTIYNVRVNELYHNLVNQYMSSLKEEAGKGQVTEIGQHYFVRNGHREDFDNALNTIPLNILFKLMNINTELSAKNMHYIHIQTEDLDFEGANQLLVVDDIFDFWKVSNIAPNRYLFYFHNDIEHYGMYLQQLMKKFDILDGTSVEDVIPQGEIPDLKELEEKAGIFCVGSYAQWDWCMDIGSCILRMMRYSSRNHKSQRMTKL